MLFFLVVLILQLSWSGSSVAAQSQPDATASDNICLPVETIFDEQTMTACHIEWYTGGVRKLNSASSKLQLGEVGPIDKCVDLVPTFFCLYHNPYCRNSTVPLEEFYTVRPCLSFCNYVVNKCGKEDFRTVCETLLDDYAPPISETEFKKGTFLSDIYNKEGQPTNVLNCIPHYEAAINSKKSHCAGQMQTTQKTYHFLDREKCGAPCNKLLFTETDRSVIRKWSFSWSTLCFLSCLFTFVTYLLDRERFNYPEVSIIYLSFCYIFISLCYIIGFFSGNSLSCTSQDMDDRFLHIGTNSSVVTQSVSYFGCTVSFAVIYYFTLASCLWWVVLCFTWYLTAGLKWSHEAISGKAVFLHAVVWILPMVMTVLVICFKGIEGDDLTGTCFTGTLSTKFLTYFVFLPMLLFLLIGFAFVVFGLVSMCRIRSVIKVTFDSKSADSFQKLMVRIGMFSLFYMVPMSVVVACYYYEIANRNSWFRTWNCVNDGSLCEFKPQFTIFVMKYFLNMVVGIASLFWVMSYKTLNLWLSVFCACTELGRNSKRKNECGGAGEVDGIKQLGITANMEMQPNSQDVMVSKTMTPHSNMYSGYNHQGNAVQEKTPLQLNKRTQLVQVHNNNKKNEFFV